MLKAMKDYNETCLKPSLGWIKRHWKGYALFVVGVYVVSYGIAVALSRLENEKFIKAMGELVKKAEEEES